MSRSIVARAFTSVMLLVIQILIAGSVAGAAHGQPAADGNQTDLTLPWPALGLPSTVNLYGEGQSHFTVALPSGLAATRLRGMIHAPTDMVAGYVEIDDREGNFLASIDLPPATPGVVVAPFDVDISAASVRDSSIDLSFTIRDRDDRDDLCTRPPQLELSNLATVFAGTQLPVTTVANFFAPVLGKFTIYAPTDASSAEQEAVLTLASAVSRYYAAQSLSIAVVGQLRGAEPPPLLGLIVRSS